MGKRGKKGKRGQNEGSIHERPDGRWVAVISLGFEGGKRKRKSYYGKSAAEVRDKLIKARAELQQGMRPAPDNIKTGKYFEDWLSTRSKGVRASTIKSYRGYVVNHIVPEIGHIPLTKLTPQHIDSLLKKKLEAGLAPRTVRYIQTILRMGLKGAEKWGLVARNVASLTESIPQKRPTINPLTLEEAQQFLDSLKGHRDEAMYALTLATGLRQGEVLGLHWEDIDFEKKALRVRVALQRIDGEFRFVEPKTARSKRTLIIPDSILVRLLAHQVRQREESSKAADRWQEWGLVFTTETGKPRHAASVTHNFQELLASAGFRHQRFHDLRHACASILLAEKVHPRVVMELLGHSQIAITLDTYSHVIPALLGETAGHMDRLLGGR